MTERQVPRAAPLAERYGVQVGVQPHHGRFVSSALGVAQLLDGLPVDRFRVVWDAGHDALAGDDPRVTLELVADQLAIANLENAVYARVDGAWKPRWVPGPEGLADLSAAFAERLGWTGPVCLSGQYSDGSVPVEERLGADLRTARLSAPGGSRSARSASQAG